jgi:uncharacterized LabA/DUF88 family protein
MSKRVAVYIDFDNVVISRYDNVHGKGAWHKDNARLHRKSANSADTIDQKLAAAHVDIGAIIDYATSFGNVSLSRAYADWSIPANSAYREGLVERAIDLVQLFAASGTKNGADIRLTVDAVEDLMRDRKISHLVLVAGDSDFVPLAQRCRRLGRAVVGIGVAGSTSKALRDACTDFIDYAELPGVAPLPAKKSATRRAPAKKASARKPSAKAPSVDAATDLLVRAIRLGQKSDTDGWLNASGIKSQMQRMDPSFKEKSLGFTTFRAFVESCGDQVESKANANGQLMVRLA